MGGEPRDVSRESLEPGLYLVATPIGNLEDITLRALRVLGSCSLVAAEDTRRIRKLLNHFEIKVKTISYREQNRARVIPTLLDEIRGGSAVALVSDAGTPCISDPGAELVAACRKEDLSIFSVPGASAVVSALAASGFVVDSFTFIGFPPARQQSRRKFFEEIRERRETLVLFESPHRLLDTLQDILAVLGDRQAVIARELTKIHEEWLAGKISELLESLAGRDRILGEFTIVITSAGPEVTPPADDNELRGRYQALIAEGVQPNAALKLLAEKTGRNKRELYKLIRQKKG